MIEQFLSTISGPQHAQAVLTASNSYEKGEMCEIEPQWAAQEVFASRCSTAAEQTNQCQLHRVRHAQNIVSADAHLQTLIPGSRRYIEACQGRDGRSVVVDGDSGVVGRADVAQSV